MKTIMKFTGLLMLLCVVSLSSMAQNTRKERQAKKVADIKAMIEANNYVFKAQSANPMRGGTFNLITEYDLSVAQDTLIAYLPYFGRAYQAPMDPTDGGIHFTSTRFSYNKQQTKDGGWEISVKTTDAKGIEQLFLSISQDGYAQLRITSTNRDPITFDGYIEQRKKS
jgi:hypothetical protein